MVVKYDSLDRFETPNLVLCNPGSVFTPSQGALSSGTISRSLFQLDHISDMEISFNFNTTSELNFRIHLIEDDDPHINLHNRTMYRSVLNRRLIFVEDIGYFSIKEIETGYDGYTDYKDVHAESIESEIQSKTVPYIEDGTYRFSTSLNDVGLLDMLMEQLPLWTVGHIDATVASRHRTFSDIDVSTNCLGLMLDQMQDAYECIFVFDIIHRIINVYDQGSYAHETNIHITKDDLIQSLQVTENADDLYTAIYVAGSDNETISAVNPLGNNTLYKFDYYIDWMSDQLATKVSAWESELETVESDYYELNLEYYEKMTDRSILQMDNSKYNIQAELYQRMIDNIIATSGTAYASSYNSAIVDAGGSAIDITDKSIEELKTEISLAANNCYDQIGINMKTIETLTSDITDLQTAIASIVNRLSLNKYFTAQELTELNNYIFEAHYKDDFITITDSMSYNEQFEQMKLMYDRAKSKLNKISAPSQEFSVDVDNFIFQSSFAPWTAQLETGCVINVELESYRTIVAGGGTVLESYTHDVAPLFLTNTTINYEDHNLSMTFGSRLNRYDTKALFEDVLGNISKTSNSLSFVQEIVTPLRDGTVNKMKEAIQSSRDLTMGAALTATNEDVVIDGSGYTGRTRLDSDAIQPEYDPRQIKITGQNIVFTNDAWDHSATAIGQIVAPDGTTAYGVNANVLIGDVIYGNQLKIKDADGNDMFSVLDDRIQSNVNDIQALSNSVFSQTGDSILIEINKIKNDIENTTVKEVKTEHNEFLFNDEGLTISKSDTGMATNIDENGMDVISTHDGESKIVLQADSSGVNSLNLHSRQFLIIGNDKGRSRFEDYKTNRTACYFIG